MESHAETASGSGSDEVTPGVRLVVLNLPEDEGEGLGFRLTRTLWDPYPWVREVVPNSRADVAALKVGDCLLQTDGRDLLGLPVGQVAGLIRGDGASRGVSLLVWNCGVDPKDDPELLWSCGGGSRGEKSRRALAGVIKALSCCVCAATATRSLSCARSHLYCEACWSRLDRCALCRESLPAKDSPYARNLVAEQVFEAIATEYEIKDTMRRPTESVSISASQNRSPTPSPAVNRKGQYKISMMSRQKKNVQFRQNYASDPNIHRSTQETYTQHSPTSSISSTNSNFQTGNTYDLRGKCNSLSFQTGNTCDLRGKFNCVSFQTGNTGCDLAGKCNCQKETPNVQVPEIKIEDTTQQNVENTKCCCHNQRNNIQHKLVTRLRQACSMADLQNAVHSCSCPISGSLNNISGVESCPRMPHSSSLDNLKTNCSSISESQPAVFVLSAPPIYVLACDHKIE